MTRLEYLDAKRRECWRLGIQHREALLRKLMAKTGMRERPFLKDVINELLIEAQGVRLREEALPLDTFAQSERVNGRVEVSVNNRIAEMPGVKDAEGVAYVAKWHESIHVERDLCSRINSEPGTQLALPQLEAEIPRLIVCRRAGTGNNKNADEREFIAESAALAAAIAPADLVRSPAFTEFQALAAWGGDVTMPGWHLLYDTAYCIGVNITALVKYLSQQGMIQVMKNAGRPRLIAAARFPLWNRDDSSEPKP